MTKPHFVAGVLFDLDGTLVDTASDFVVVVNNMRKNDGLTALDPERIRNTVSDGARALIHLAYDMQEGEPHFEDKRQQLLNLYTDELGKSAKLFEGFETLLKTLEEHNIGWGIVTNKPAQLTNLLLQRINLNPSLGVAICPDHVKQAKPHPEPILLAMEKLGLTSQNCIYVGDHKRDIEAAKAAKLKSIACRYGYIKPTDDIHSWQADIIVDSVTELSQELDTFIKKFI